MPLRGMPNYVRLLVGHSATQLGTQFTYLAIPFVAVEILDASATELGILASLGFAPFVLLGLPVGVLVDRRSRKGLMVGSEILRAIVIAIAAFLLISGSMSMPLLYALTTLMGVLAVVYDIASQSILPELVPRQLLVEANQGLEVGRSAAQIGGPGVAGLVIQFFGAATAFVLDAFSYLISGWMLARLRLDSAPDTRASLETRWWDDITDGIRFVFKHDLLRRLALTSAVANLGVAAMEALFVLYSLRFLDISAGELGLVFAIGNLGILAGSMVAGRLSRIVPAGSVLAIGAVVQALGVLLVPLAALGAPVLVLAGAQASRAFGVILWNVVGISIRQVLTPTESLGKVNATMRVVSWSGLLAGGLIGGLTADAIGVRPTLFAAFAIVLGAATIVTRRRVLTFRMPTEN